MGFMDSVTSFTKGVGAKAKGNYDVVSLNAQISSIQREITGLYTSIGERYYETHKDSPEECFSGMIKEVNDRVARINSIQREIESTKEAMASVSFTAAQPSVRYCVKCGTPLELGSVFCVKCGAKQPGADGDSVEVPVAEPVMQESPVAETNIEAFNETANDVSAVEAEIKCPVCGVSLKAGSAFCTTCGSKLD